MKVGRQWSCGMAGFCLEAGLVITVLATSVLVIFVLGRSRLEIETESWLAFGQGARRVLHRVGEGSL